MDAKQEAKQCPWCDRWCLKDKNCNYIFACGLDETKFNIGQGCGRSWCFLCGKKFCGQLYDPKNGLRSPVERTFHDSKCCKFDKDYNYSNYCPGGHNSHCDERLS